MTESAEPQIVTTTETPTAVIRGRVPMAELAGFFDRAFGLLGSAIAEQGISVTGAAFARYEGEPTDVADLEVGFAITSPVAPSGEVVASSLPAGRVARVVHSGSFDDLGASWGRLAAWIGEHGLTPSPVMWEVYLTEPSPEMDPADLRTELNWLLSD